MRQCTIAPEGIKYDAVFQRDWTGQGSRGLRDYVLIPAIFFGAVSPGLYVSSVLTDYTFGIWLAIIMNFMGYGVTHLMYLGRAERFWRALMNIKTSWISRGFLFNALFGGFGFLYAASISGIAPFLSTPTAIGALKILSLMSAIAFAAYPGFMLMIVKAIPFWRSIMEPVIFFLQGILGGIAIQVIGNMIFGMEAEIVGALITINYIFALAVLVMLMIALLNKALHGGAGKASVEFLISGGFSRAFIGGAIGIGLVAPIFIIAVAQSTGLDFKHYGFLYYISMAMELIGIYLAKYGMLRAGAYAPLR